MLHAYWKNNILVINQNDFRISSFVFKFCGRSCFLFVFFFGCDNKIVWFHAMSNEIIIALFFFSLWTNGFFRHAGAALGAIARHNSAATIIKWIASTDSDLLTCIGLSQNIKMLLRLFFILAISVAIKSIDMQEHILVKLDSIANENIRHWRKCTDDIWITNTWQTR